MLTNYLEFVPTKFHSWSYLTPQQMEINKKGQYLRKYWHTNGVYVYTYDGDRENCIRKYRISQCKTIEDRFKIYVEMIDFIVSDILRYDPFK